MRLLRLDLIAFGPFEGRSLELASPGAAEPGLTIVYGPNEAGKSTALRAVRQLFFGIEGDNDAYRVARKSRKVGALIEADGVVHDVLRRASNARALFRLDDKTRYDDDSAVVGLLDRLDSSSYRTLYGLHHDDLAEGAETIMRSDGDLDSVLFAAEHVKDLRQVRQELVGHAEELFTPQARTGKEINRLLGEVARIDKEIAEAKRPIDRFHQLRDAMADLDADVAERRHAKAALAARIGRLERYAELFADHVRRGELSKELEALADVPLADDEIERAWRLHDRQASEAAIEERSALADCEEAEKALGELGPASPLSGHADRVARLGNDAAVLANERGRSEALQRERARLTREAEEILKSIGDRVTHADLAGLALPKTFAESVRKLVQSRAKLDEDEAGKTRRRRQMQDALRDLEAAPVEDDGDAAERLDECLRRASAAEELVAERARLEDAQRAKVGFVRDWIARRMTVERDPSTLAALPVPERVAIEEAAARRRKNESRADALIERRREIDEKLVDLRLRLRSEGAESLPAREDRDAARAARDESLRRLASRVSEIGDASKSSQAIRAALDAEARTLADAVREADRVADVLAEEADRCARVRQARLEEQATIERSATLEAERQEADAVLAADGEAWKALWSDAGARVGSPQEMLLWRQEWERCVQEIADANSLGAQGRELHARVEDARQALLKELAGDAKLAESTSLADAISIARKAKGVLEERRRKSDVDRDRRETLRRDLKALEQELTDVADRRRAWEADWEKTTRKVPAPVRAAPDETLVFLEQFGDWRRLRDELAKIDDDLAGLADNARRFDDDVRSLATDLCEPPPVESSATVRRWILALDEARARDEKEKRLRARSEKKRAEATVARDRVAVAEAGVRRICQAIGVDDPRAVEARLEEARRKRTTAEAAAGLDDRLRERLPRSTWEELGRELESWSPETLQAEIRALGEQVVRIDDELKGRYERLAVLREEKRVWNGESRAAELEQGKQRLLAELTDLAERYAVYRLAAATLDRTIERFRDRNKNPILERAGVFFRELTRGAFRGLEPDTEADGGIAVIGMRDESAPEPRETPVAGMSRGTCDQLYLAFRMALWEERLEKGSPIPIMLDDVLVHFDDERATAALRAFDELAKRTQVVYFTHHRHLVDLARRTLPADRLRIEELPDRGAT